MDLLTIHLTKSVDENAALYFEKAKKAKRKILGANAALAHSKNELLELQKKADLEKLKEQEKKSRPLEKKEWYEKFRWFFSSEGFLVIGGRDATSNEVVIKKYTLPQDIVFHTDMAGSPFFVIKTDGKPIGKATVREVADATVTFSRAWKLGLGTTSVFYVSPEQVSKKTKAGEYMSKGAFMIYGKTNYIENAVNCAVGLTPEGKIMAGPREAVAAHCKKIVEIILGREKTSTVAKFIAKIIGGNLDDIVRALPAGGCAVLREKK